MLELLRRHVNLHGHGLRLKHAAVQLWHLLDEGVRDGIANRVALHVLRVELAEDLELLLDQSGALYLLLLGGGEDVLGLRPLPLLRLESGLAEGRGWHGLSFSVEDHLLGP